jgi:predicted methyltransferase
LRLRRPGIARVDEPAPPVRRRRFFARISLAVHVFLMRSLVAGGGRAAEPGRLTSRESKMASRRVVVGLICGSVLQAAGTPALGAAAAAGPYAAVLADPARGDDRTDDARRKPGEILAFGKVKAGDKVLDLIPGGGYFSRLFSRAVGPKGHVYAEWTTEYAKEAHPDPETQAAMSRRAPWTNITVQTHPAKALVAPEPLDLVFTSQNYHDYPDPFMGPTDPAILNKAVFKALKPGGLYLIIDHAAPKGSGLKDTNTLHRIDAETVKAQVMAAGFVFDGESQALRNPKDPRTVAVFDKSIRGHTDQFMLRFRKP